MGSEFHKNTIHMMVAEDLTESTKNRSQCAHTQQERRCQRTTRSFNAEQPFKKEDDKEGRSFVLSFLPLAPL